MGCFIPNIVKSSKYFTRNTQKYKLNGKKPTDKGGLLTLLIKQLTGATPEAGVESHIGDDTFEEIYQISISTAMINCIIEKYHRTNRSYLSDYEFYEIWIYRKH
ncbi:MAG: hypothetical protein LGB53_04990 [Sulfurovum sp.]|nr:hypothetical protein [Sulfurovum sp.]